VVFDLGFPEVDDVDEVFDGVVQVLVGALLGEVVLQEDVIACFVEAEGAVARGLAKEVAAQHVGEKIFDLLRGERAEVAGKSKAGGPVHYGDDAIFKS